MTEKQYAGFWIRVGASIVDTILLILVTLPLIYVFYGESYWESTAMVKGSTDFLISYALPAAAVILFWVYKSATPGKMVTDLTIVDANSGGKPTTSQFIIRYLGYILSALVLCIGFLWIAFDKRKQGWHDKLAGTVVVKG